LNALEAKMQQLHSDGIQVFFQKTTGANWASATDPEWLAQLNNRVKFPIPL
jgi:hypothetical protein